MWTIDMLISSVDRERFNHLLKMERDLDTRQIQSSLKKLKLTSQCWNGHPLQPYTQLPLWFSIRFPPDEPDKSLETRKFPTSSIIASRRTIAHRQRCQVRLRSYVKEIKRKVTTVDGESEIIKSYLWLTFRHLAPAHSLKITKCHPGITPFRHQVIMLSGHHIAMSSCRI